MKNFINKRGDKRLGNEKKNVYKVRHKSSIVVNVLVGQG